jgi:rubrerythrin
MGNIESTPDEPLMVAWYCMICGEVTLAAEQPSDCPFCGSNGEEYLVVGMPPERDAVGELAPEDRQMLRTSLRMEIADREKYLALSRAADNAKGRATWKRLSRIEAEHATVFAELLAEGAPQPGATVPLESLGREIEKAWQGESGAVASYVEFAEATRNWRLKTVWTALARVEAGHRSLMEGAAFGV